MIRFANVFKEYPRTGIALNDISFQVAKGEFVFLTGPSGAGKIRGRHRSHGPAGQRPGVKDGKGGCSLFLGERRIGARGDHGCEACRQED
jgi:hypothetical protein